MRREGEREREGERGGEREREREREETQGGVAKEVCGQRCLFQNVR